MTTKRLLSLDGKSLFLLKRSHANGAGAVTVSWESLIVLTILEAHSITTLSSSTTLHIKKNKTITQFPLIQHFLDSQGVSIDSRTIEPDQIFFAIKGDNFDGHKYVQEVLDQGAKLAVIDNPDYEVDGKTVLVSAVLESLQALANMYRTHLDIPVLAITGSNGKTTTKELIHATLSTHYAVHTTPGNLNNHLGVPLTILGASKATEILVVEMGANHIGEIAALCGIADPDCGLITNIGQAHLEGFGSYEGVIEAKTELYKYLAQRKRLIFCNDSDKVLMDNLPPNCSMIGYPSDQVSFYTEEMKLGFRLKKYTKKYLSRLTGSYNQNNILAALTVGEYFQVDTAMSCRAISSYSPKMNRSEIFEVNGTTLILDAYNANPTSMRAALESFGQLVTEQRKIIILGDMKELGTDEEQLHREILTIAREVKESEMTIVIGEIFHSISQEREGGMEYESYDAFEDDFKKIEHLLKGSLVLIKASRSLKLERIKDLLA